MLTNAAEFGRLSNEPELHITSVVHKSFIEINEAGMARKERKNHVSKFPY